MMELAYLYGTNGFSGIEVVTQWQSAMLVKHFSCLITYVLKKPMISEKVLTFCRIYGITDVVQFNDLYEIDEIVLFLPPNPTESEKTALQELAGVQGITYGFMDYIKSNHTFELIMQWREKTDNA